jgi:ABC-type Fe3+/spermidine/putrescine transport system ATPase subunit
MTVFKNVLGDLSLRGYTADEIKARTKEMESWPWLSPIFYRACRELNKEELYLAALARALAPEPEKLLVELPEEPSPSISQALDHVKNITAVTITKN